MVLGRSKRYSALAGELAAELAAGLAGHHR